MAADATALQLMPCLLTMVCIYQTKDTHKNMWQRQGARNICAPGKSSATPATAALAASSGVTSGASPAAWRACCASNSRWKHRSCAGFRGFQHIGLEARPAALARLLRVKLALEAPLLRRPNGCKHQITAVVL